MSDWRDRAACLNARDPDDWFTDDPQRKAMAVAVCAGCPSQVDCLTFAMESADPHGVWAGMDLTDRRDLGVRPHFATAGWDAEIRAERKAREKGDPEANRQARDAALRDRYRPGSVRARA